MTVELPVAIICARIVLKEQIGSLQIVGIVIMLASICIMNYYKVLRNPWLCLFLLFSILGIMDKNLPIFVIGLFSFIPTVIYHLKVVKYRNASKVTEN